MSVLSRQLLFATMGALLSVHAAHASVATYTDKSSFLADTLATQATASYPTTGALPGSVDGPHTSFVSGSVTLSAPAGLYFGNAWSTRLGIGTPVISINGMENLSLALGAPAYAVGFDFVEPESDPFVNAPFVDSTFIVTLHHGANTVGSFTFSAPNDTGAFVGAWSTLSFDRVAIVETTGGIENEFFGQFYAGTLAPVPEPETYALMLAGLGVLSLVARRQRDKAA